MQEKNDNDLGESQGDQAQTNQFETLARNMVRLFDQGAKAVSTLGRAHQFERDRSLQHGLGGRRGGKVAG